LNSLEVNLQQLGKPGGSIQQSQKTFSDLGNAVSVFRNRIGRGFARSGGMGGYAKVLDWKQFARATPLNLELSKGEHRAAGEPTRC
jgi:hypothetical protein